MTGRAERRHHLRRLKAKTSRAIPREAGAGRINPRRGEKGEARLTLQERRVAEDLLI